MDLDAEHSLVVAGGSSSCVARLPVYRDVSRGIPNPEASRSLLVEWS